MKTIILVLTFLLATPPGTAMVMELVQDQIEIDVGYTGTKVTVFVSSNLLAASNTAFALTITGLEQPHRITRKQGSNTEHFNFVSAPYIWLLAAEPQFVASTPAPDWPRLDMSTLAMPAPGDMDAPGLADWRAAFVRLKLADGLFADNGVITRLGKNMLRADIVLPSYAPAGLYNIQALLLSDGKLSAKAETDLLLIRSGVENWLFDLAYNNKGFYGLLAVLTGIVLGGAGAFIGRR